MTTSLRAVRLAGGQLQDHRHVCAMVEGPDETFELMLPFVREGLEEGHRVFLIVDPAERDAFPERLRVAGIDVSAATRSHQLEIRTWDDAYLFGGSFDGARQLEFIRRTLAEGSAMGFPLTRLIGTTDWALDRDTAAELVLYEQRLDDLMGTLPDVVVCVYDLDVHSTRTIAEVVGLHPVAVVDGTLRTHLRQARPSPRDRLIAAASQLFDERGVQATGVDLLVETAGVAKATFYRHFPSKDDLVVAWLRDSRTRWFDRVRAKAQAAAVDPRGEILLFFQEAAAWLEAGDYRGCPYLNVAVEMSDTAHPARAVVREVLDEVGAYLRSLAEDAGYVDAETLGKELHALLAGTITLGFAHGTGAFAASSREAARQLLANAERRDPRT